jgi:hypothetical protein
MMVTARGASSHIKISPFGLVQPHDRAKVTCSDGLQA